MKVTVPISIAAMTVPELVGEKDLDKLREKYGAKNVTSALGFRDGVFEEYPVGVLDGLDLKFLDIKGFGPKKREAVQALLELAGCKFKKKYIPKHKVSIIDLLDCKDMDAELEFSGSISILLPMNEITNFLWYARKHPKVKTRKAYKNLTGKELKEWAEDE